MNRDFSLIQGMIIPSLKCVAWNARLVVVGFAAGTIEKIPANLLLLKQVSVVGLFWGGNTSTSFFRVLSAYFAGWMPTDNSEGPGTCYAGRL